MLFDRHKHTHTHLDWKRSPYCALIASTTGELGGCGHGVGSSLNHAVDIDQSNETKQEIRNRFFLLHDAIEYIGNTA